MYKEYYDTMLSHAAAEVHDTMTVINEMDTNGLL